MEFFSDVMSAILGSSGFAAIPQDWRQLLMIAIACVLLYLGIGRGFEPLLLVPIAFGMLLANLPLTGLFNRAGGGRGYPYRQRWLYVGHLSGRPVRHLPVHYLYGDRGNDGLRPSAG